MICKFCNGEYPSDVPVCPYCGTENEEVADRRKKEILTGYDKEERDIRKQAEEFPKKAAHKLTKYILMGIAGVLAAGIVIALISILVGKLSVNLSYKNEQVHLEKLEELYQTGDYAAIKTYLRKHDLWSRDFEKYSQVAEAYEKYVHMEEAAEEIEEIISEGVMTYEEKVELCSYWMENILEYAAKVLHTCDEYANDKIFLQNEEELQALYDRCTAYLKEFGFATEDIELLQNWDGESDLEEQMRTLQEYFFENVG